MVDWTKPQFAGSRGWPFVSAAKKPQPKRPRGRPPRPPELVRLVVHVPDDLKKWLRHRAIDEGRDMGLLVTEAIQLLEQDRAKRDRSRRHH